MTAASLPPASPAAKASPGVQPKLSGLRVIDLSQFLPGPFCTLMLADHGAEVIKVESLRGEPTRAIGQRQGGVSVYFRNTQRGKRSLAIDLKRPEGREALGKLMETADVVVESFRPGVVERLGVGYAQVKARAPRLVYCSISAFGQDGSRRGRVAHDLSVQAYAGSASLQCDEQGRPVIPGLPAADMLSSLMAYGGIMTALWRRERSGRGDYLDISMFDATLAWTSIFTPPVFAEGRAPVPGQERTMGGAALYQVYATQDGRYLTLGGSEHKFLVNLLEALGRPELIPLGEAPWGEQKPLIEELQRIFRTRTLAAWEAWFADKDVCFGPVRQLNEVFLSDPFVREREMLWEDAQGNHHVGVPIRFREEKACPRPQTPGLGEHSRAILAALGYAPAEIERWVAEGIVGVAGEPTE